MQMRQLEILSNDVLAGILTETDDRKYVFVYDDSYINSDMSSISMTLPKNEKEFHADYLFPFFANILPEGANKDYICRRFHIDEDDSMGLLMAFSGKDFIGSIGVRTIK